MLEKLEVLELDLEVQYCNSNHCDFDCTTPVNNVCTAKITGLM